MTRDRTTKVKGRRPVRRFVPKVVVKEHKRGKKPVGPHVRKFPKARPVVESESNAGSATASFHTSSVNAPLGYQGLFRGN